jgi:1-acyl-sn-glycerol-3-phosphate acyltransferase
VNRERKIFGIRVEQPRQPSWLFAVNKIWITALSVWHRLRVVGRFPADGPVLLVANHVDAVDPMILANAVSRAGRRSLTMIARSEFFDIPLVRSWLRLSGAIPIRRDEADLAALRFALEELKAGHVVATFPQATRAHGRRGEFGQIKAGAVYIAARAGVPVVPAAVLGTGTPLLSRRRYEVRFGAPFVVPPIQRKAGEDEMAERVALMEQRMLALLPPEYKRDRLH